MSFQAQSAERLLPIREVIGNPNATPPISPLIPVSRSTWLAGVKAGRFPKPVRISPRRVAWRKSDIDRLIADLGA